MSSMNPFSDLPVLGAFDPEAAALKLQEVGEASAAAMITERESVSPPETFSRGISNWWPFADRAWQHTAHTFGFLPAVDGGVGAARNKIKPAGAIEADKSLRNARVKIALNQLR